MCVCVQGGEGSMADKLILLAISIKAGFCTNELEEMIETSQTAPFML